MKIKIKTITLSEKILSIFFIISQIYIYPMIGEHQDIYLGFNTKLNFPQENYTVYLITIILITILVQSKSVSLINISNYIKPRCKNLNLYIILKTTLFILKLQFLKILFDMFLSIIFKININIIIISSLSFSLSIIIISILASLINIFINPNISYYIIIVSAIFQPLTKYSIFISSEDDFILKIIIITILIILSIFIKKEYISRGYYQYD